MTKTLLCAVILLATGIGICSSFVDDSVDRIGRSRNNRWISGVAKSAPLAASGPTPISLQQDDMYKILTDVKFPGQSISRPLYHPIPPTSTSLENSPGFETPESKFGDGTVKYEEVQDLLEHFLNSRLDLSSNLDVITQAFRFVKLDAHLEALIHQLKKLQESQDSLQRVTTAQGTKFELLMEQMTKLVNSVNSESGKMERIEKRLESEIGTMNHRLESAVEKIITSTAASQIMLDLSKESLQQMDRVEGAGNEVLSSLKNLKTELGDVGQASIQVIYNVQKSEETVMRAIAESGNRTIYALRQEPSSVVSTAAVGENGRRGNFIQADASASDDDSEDDEGTAARFLQSKKTKTLRPLSPSKKSMFPCSERKRLINGRPKDCAQVQLSGTTRSGIYKIFPFENSTTHVEVYCDLENHGGGWTIIQRRIDTQAPREDFFRNWHDYETGFGSATSHLWLGLSALSALTGSGEQTLRVELKDWEGIEKYANYGYFRVTNASEHYKLHVADFFGNAGDSLAYHNGMPFSTKDKDNDLERTLSCANRYHGGWWYKNCHQSNLNGLYVEGNGRQDTYATGINWYTWHGYYYSLKSTEMKIRPRNFNL